MHILILPSWYPTAATPINGVFFQEQAHALKRSGCRVGVIAPAMWSIPIRIKKPKQLTWGFIFEDDNGIPTLRLHGKAWVHSRSKVTCRRWLQSGQTLFGKYMSEFGTPDIIHAHSAIHAGFLADKIKKDFNIPYVITEHSSVYQQRSLPEWKKILVASAYKNADARIAVSPSLGRFLKKQFGSAMYPWLWIPNPLSEEFCQESNTLKYHHTNKPFTFLNIATMNKIKRQEDILFAFSKKFKGDPDIHLCIGGDGPMKKSLIKLSRTLGINQQVEFLGSLDRKEVLESMNAANVFVLSSDYETFGIVLIEALACGLPIIATTSGGPECIANDINGILVEPRNIDQLASAMSLTKDHYSRYSLQAIRDDCIARFGPSRIINQTIDLYNNVLRASSDN